MTRTAKIEKKYVVRLAITAAGRDPSDAVRDAVEQVRRGGLENLTYSVHEVGGRTGTHPNDDETYRGQFLG
ncbi:hypothetical protein [Pengzhenrongella sp.]|jgi:hypothetical protein|uniref:hypothetical protein n=1 Tax=Pengzhenrongella sp. TaxID=2888820 RepID=UPI002F956729